MIVLLGFLKERITILFQKYETRVPDCHRCSKAVTNLIPSGGRKIIHILKAHKVVLISQNYTLGLNGWRYEKLPIAGDFLSSYKKVEAGYNPSHTTGTLIGYIVCWQQFFIFFF